MKEKEKEKEKKKKKKKKQKQQKQKTCLYKPTDMRRLDVCKQACAGLSRHAAFRDLRPVCKVLLRS